MFISSAFKILVFSLAFSSWQLIRVPNLDVESSTLAFRLTVNGVHCTLPIGPSDFNALEPTKLLQQAKLDWIEFLCNTLRKLWYYFVLCHLYFVERINFFLYTFVVNCFWHLRFLSFLYYRFLAISVWQLE